MKKLALYTSALILLAAGTALGQDVRYNFDKEADFSRFKTYKWVAMKDATKIDDLRERQIKDSVDAELGRKGLTKTESDTADLFIGYQAGIGTEKQYTSYDTGWGYGPGWGGGGWYGGGGGITTGETSTIYIGQLAIDMYDAKKKNLAWRGAASKTIDPKAKPEKQQKNLDKAVAKLLKNFPPPPPKAK